MMTNAISRGELWMTLLAPNVNVWKGFARPCRRQTAN
jgi:hypothetical protein